MPCTEKDFVLNQEALIDNSNPRIPICLVIDISSSMQGKPIAELQRGVGKFFEELRADKTTATSTEVAIVTFSSHAKTVLDFRALNTQEIPHFNTYGLTSMGEGVMHALDVIDSRKKQYQAAGIDYYQPWLVMMTDGYPTDDISAASDAIYSLVKSRRLTVFPIGIDSADTSMLSRLGGGHPVLKLQGLKFSNFFAWLSKSVSCVLQSTPGKSVTLPSGLETWAEF